MLIAGNESDEIAFETLSGELRVRKSDKGLIMDFPAYYTVEHFSTNKFQYNNEPINPVVNEIANVTFKIVSLTQKQCLDPGSSSESNSGLSLHRTHETCNSP